MNIANCPSVWRARPLLFGAIPVQFDAVAFRVAQIDGFAHAVVGRAFERNLRHEHSAKSFRERGARGIHDRGVVQTSGAARWERAAEAFPGVERDVVVIATRGEKHGSFPEPLGDLKPEDPGVELQRAVEIGHFQVYVADSHVRVNHKGFVRALIHAFVRALIRTSICFVRSHLFVREARRSHP